LGNYSIYKEVLWQGITGVAGTYFCFYELSFRIALTMVGAINELIIKKAKNRRAETFRSAGFKA
jgi:hypothetical protein